ncbi:hypothetical protein M5W83_12075 [Paenibacillus thiaminolyticus]|uniref:Lipoprotein n=1 Tax=Paenibacillus thiaminolyticus TaxID=49283 RepID=A0AAP9DVJ8_PANTH|nr:hypothetical protein [Paenibacillus thiaminolyticus]MCY9538286.1 hypothetical protein [Paenibacillus thiaminolyticus]MCY9604715.1 hypothetical protein [Paenibacillus thiaminolyticus]MCY9607882.1 hypothetical protein [Paenibacillus thiaminolyticus]MCY9615386.1 hypothetical protein [Paenibacillus thiaminolyticus]MCY9622163.1 hypothetical protein [Paenibacillus thiaminolyticus]
MRYFLYLTFILSLFVAGCSSQEKLPTSSNEWKIIGVIWNGYMYQATEEMVTEIDEKIGTVEKYSDDESFLKSYKDTFSNKYPVGTNLYSIKGVPVTEAIAAEVSNNTHYKLYCEGKIRGDESGKCK